MTINEQQELKILTLLISNKITTFNSMKFPDVLTNALGNGASALVQNMARDGFIADLYTGELELTKAAHERYKLLRKQYRQERVSKMAFWMIFACTIVAAGDVVYKHLYPESIPKIPTISGQPTLPPTKDTSHSVIPNTAKYQKKDSAAKKVN